MSAEPTRRLPSSAAAAAIPLAAPIVAPADEPASEPQPPRARRVARTDTRHGDTRIDEYYWLRERDNPEVIAYLEAENAYAQAMMRHTEPLQERLYRELVGRIQETDLSVPERLDDFYYYTRIESGRQYPVLCRKCATPEAAEQVLVDLNALAGDQAYLRLGANETSPNHRYLAYSLDFSGAEEFVLRIKDLVTGTLLPETIPNTARGVAWANDSATLFYTVLDAAKRPFALFRHRLGTDPSEDVLVYREEDEAFFIDVDRTRSREYLLLEIGSHTTSEVRYLRADQPEGTFRVLHPREPGVEYAAAHHGDRFYIVTNREAENFRLVEAPVADPSAANWRDVLPHRPAVRLDGIDVFRGHLVAYERENGLRGIRVLDLGTGATHRVEFPEPVYTVHRSNNPEFDTSVLRFVYTSPVTPSMVVDYDLATRRWEVLKQKVVRGGYDPSRYATERLFAPAPDGERVPISLVWRRPLELDGRRPMLLMGYGAYGSTLEPSFSSHYLSLLDRGFVVAIAHVRGGEELGRRWYDHGKLLRKRNSFTDFIAAAEHLIERGYTARERLAINGGSAGGLLMGAVANLRPDLFRAVVAEVPFVDVVNTMLDPTLPLTVIEYDEWGDPRDPEAYAYLKSYSPYDNIEAKDYPHLLVTGGLNDPRVAYWEPAKWTARLRAHKTDGNRLLLKTNMGAGHGGASGRYDFLREIAFKYAFILDVLGLD
jgi:oligopeptidase B